MFTPVDVLHGNTFPYQRPLFADRHAPPHESGSGPPVILTSIERRQEHSPSPKTRPVPLRCVDQRRLIAIHCVSLSSVPVLE